MCGWRRRKSGGARWCRAGAQRGHDDGVPSVHRACDRTTVAAAVVSCDRVRAQLESIAALAGPEEAPGLGLGLGLVLAVDAQSPVAEGELAPGPYPRATQDAPTPPRRPVERRWPDEPRRW